MPNPTYPPAPEPGPRHRPTRWKTLVAAGTVGLVALAGGAAWLATDPFDASTTRAATSAGEDRWPAGAPPVQQADAAAPDWVAVAEAVTPSVVSINVEAGAGGGKGSGVVLDKEGHVMTNHHVIAGAGATRGAVILVTLNDNRTYAAEVVGSDAATDLGILAIQEPPTDLRPITMGNDNELKVGTPVMAVGNPLGLSGTVTTGIVSALDRPVTTTQARTGPAEGGELAVTNAIQTSAAINPGNSGGALVNASGQLVGINSSIAQLSEGGGNIGIGFAIPVNEARSANQQLLASGTVQHAFLGVSSENGAVPEGGARRAAAVIATVQRGTPAAQAGIRAGDAIVALDGATIDGPESLLAQVRAQQVGKTVTVTIIRDGRRQDVQATLTAKPDATR